MMLEVLLKMLQREASAEATAWLEGELQRFRGNFELRPFYYAFSGVSRRFDKANKLSPSEAETQEIRDIDAAFIVSEWDEFRIARVILLLVLAEQEEDLYRSTLDTLLQTADIREQVAIYSAFALLPCEDFLVPMAREATRSNIVDVFDALALENPFPSRAFTEEVWNQLVLKALFISRPLYLITGLDQRANLALAEALSYLAHERWSAGRWVSPELWRCCQRFLSDEIVADLTQVAGTDEPGQKEAVALIAAQDREGRLDGVRDLVKDLIDDVEDGRLTWVSIGEQVATS